MPRHLLPDRRALIWLLLTVPAGCRTPPAHLAGCEPGVTPRRAALVRQLTADTATATVTQPLHSAASVVSGPATLVHSLGGELIACRLALSLHRPPGPIRSDREPLDSAALDAELRRLTHTELQPVCAELQADGSGALASLLHLIDGAGRQIDVLMFLWESDPVGELVAQHLANRAASGVRVRILVDGGGNLIHAHGGSAQEVNRAVCRLARCPGVELLRTRNPFACFDHRKLVVADGRLAWTGGRNFNHQSFFAQRDLSFTVAGPLACRLAEMFEEFWREQGGRKGEVQPCPDLPGEPDGQARVVGTAPHRCYLANSLYCALDRAQRSIYLENVYFSDPWVVSKLARARRRGVDVRVLLTVQSDSDTVNAANRVTANRLLAAGVRVYLCPGMLHTKAAVVDGCWAYLGTGNFDALSLRQDRELGLAVGSGILVGRLEDVLRSGHRPEWELTAPLPVSIKDHLAELLASLCL